MTNSTNEAFARHVGKQVFANCDLPPYITMISVNKIPAGPPSVTFDRSTLHINTSEEHSGDALLFDAVKEATGGSRA